MSDPDTVRAVLAEVGGLHPAVAEDAPVTMLPGVEEPWLSVSEDRVVVSLVADADGTATLPRLLRVREALSREFSAEIELRLVDLVDQAPDA